MADVNVHYFAQLKEDAQTASEVCTLHPNETPGSLYKKLHATHGFKIRAEDIRAAINDQFAGMDTPLKEGDKLAFIPPVSGG